MHVCHITSMHQWNDDRIYERACRMLVRLGHRVTLIATEGTGCDELREMGFVAIKDRPHGLGRRVLSSRDALSLARNLKADIYHFHDPDLLPWMRRLAAEGRHVVYDVHENYQARFDMWGLPGPLSRLSATLFRAYERSCAARFAGVVAVSDSVLGLFDGARQDGCVVQNVPDTERFGSIGGGDDRHGPPVIYTSGTHSDARNCLQTIDAMPYVLERHPEVSFSFVGRYDPPGYDEALRERARHLGVESALRVEGLLPWEENFRRTAKAHIGCVFYEDNPNNRVTIPNRLFEYMMCGVAVVAHDFPELANIIKGSKCGRLVDSKQAISIATGINSLLDQPDNIQIFGNNGRSAVLETYNFRQQCLVMIEFYSRILNRST